MTQTINNTQSANPAPAPAVSKGAPEDIVTRVSKAVDTPQSDPKQNTNEPNNFDRLSKEIESGLINEETLAQIKDPYARTLVKTTHENMIKGMNKKFQEVADLRKSFEEKSQQLSEVPAPKYDISTKEGLKQALNDPEFNTLVQQVAQESAPSDFLTEGGTQDDWSTLTQSEKDSFKRMQNEITQLKSQNTQNELKQIDNSIKEKYSDYDPSQIDQFIKQVNSGKVTTQELREFAYKSLNYERGLKRAYDIAKEEKGADIIGKINANSFDSSINTNNANPIPEKQEKTSKQHFIQIAKQRMKAIAGNN